jgi:hypothetical protein
MKGMSSIMMQDVGDMRRCSALVSICREAAPVAKSRCSKVANSLSGSYEVVTVRYAQGHGKTPEGCGCEEEGAAKARIQFPAPLVSIQWLSDKLRAVNEPAYIVQKICPRLATNPLARAIEGSHICNWPRVSTSPYHKCIRFLATHPLSSSEMKDESKVALPVELIDQGPEERS